MRSAPAFADLRQQRLHQRRLADSRLPRHEHQLPLPFQRLLQPLPQPPQLRVSAHQRRRPVPGDQACGGLFIRTGSGDPGPDRGHRRRRARDRPNEPKAPPVHRLDVPRRLRRIPQRLAQIADAARQRRVAHDRVPPQRRQQLVLRDQTPRALHQVSQHRERPWRQLEPTRPAPRPLVLHLEAHGGKLSGPPSPHALPPLHTGLTPPRALPDWIAWPAAPVIRPLDSRAPPAATSRRSGRPCRILP